MTALRCALLLCGLASVACGDPTAAADRAEMLRELQALRSAMTARPPQAQPDRRALDEALSPLRELLQGLVAEQDALRQRQIQLAQELGRWSALVATNAATGTAGEVAGLQDRLGKLEQSLQQQDQRHREVQELLRRALDTTADRLDLFLQRLGAEPGPKEIKASVPPPEVRGTGTAPDHVRTGAAGDGWLRPGYEPRGSRGDMLTPVLLGVGILLLSLLAWRLWREGSRPRAVEDEVDAGPAAAPATSWDAVELLAAALANGVERVETAAGRLQSGPRAAQAAEAPEPEPDPEPVLDPSDVAEWLQEPATPAAAEPQPVPPPAPPATPATPVTRPPGPVWLRVELPAAAEAEAAAFLDREPRVLRRPAPRLRVSGEDLIAELAVLPDLPPPERTWLVQRLQQLGLGARKHGSRAGPSV